MVERYAPIILILAALGLGVAMYSLRKQIREGFAAAVPQMSIPPSSRHPKSDELNGSWRQILQYLSENPEKASTFIADVKDKFFADTCAIKQPRIDFAGLPNAYRPVFV